VNLPRGVVGRKRTSTVHARDVSAVCARGDGKRIGGIGSGAVLHGSSGTSEGTLVEHLRLGVDPHQSQAALL
jgi:hypothetical protein